MRDFDNRLFGVRRGVGARRLSFDGGRRGGIQGPRLAAPLRLALGLALRATLGIPRSSVGSQAVGVGADRLALALGARRQRVAVGAEPRLARRLGLVPHRVTLDMLLLLLRRRTPR